MVKKGRNLKIWRKSGKSGKNPEIGWNSGKEDYYFRSKPSNLKIWEVEKLTKKNKRKKNW